MKSIRLSLGVVPTLIIAAAASTLAGCGGDGAEGAPHAPVAEAGSAGSGSAATGGSGGSSGSSGKSGSGATAGSEETGGTSAGTAGKSGTGGSGTGGSGSAAGSGGSASAPVNAGNYSRDDFAAADPDLADPFHPFEQRETTLLRREELAVYVPTAQTADGFVLDHPEKGFALLNASPAAALLGATTYDTASANVDEDGNDELVAVGAVPTGLSVHIGDSDANGVLNGQDSFDIAGSFKHAWIEAADVDEDGRDELLIAAVTSTGVSVSLYDDATQGFAFIKDVKSGAGEEIAVAFGNFDDDRFPELAVLTDEGTTLKLELLDDARASWASLGSISEGATGLVDQHGLTVSGLRLGVGNLDGDAADELVLFADGLSTDSNSGSVNQIQSIGIDVKSIAGGAATLALVAGSEHSFPQPNDRSYRYGNRWPWQAVVTDSNDDGIAETFVVDRHFGDNSVVVDLFHETYGTERPTWMGGDNSFTLDDDVRDGASVHLAKVTGRSNGLGADVVAIVRDDTQLTPYRLTLSTADVPPVAPSEAWTFSYTSKLETLPATVVTPSSDQVFVTGGDWDGDSLRLRFTGEKWLALARPRPIVILAVPPVKDGISQNYDDTGMSYTVSTTSSNAQTNEFSISDKVTMSFEVTFPGADFISAGASASMAQQFTRTHTKTESVTYGTEYGGSYPEDIIVFNGTLCSRYRYEIVSGGDSGEVGTFMTIDVPLESRVYKWTVSYYNRALEGQGSLIDQSVLPHTVGDPASYYTPAEKGALVGAGAWASTPKPVGQGPSSDRAFIALETEVTDETATTISTEYGAKAGAFVSAEYTRGYDETEVYSVTLSKTTEFSGFVGDIDLEDDYENWRYSYGMLIYPTTLAGGEAVNVVEYWTEGLGEGYPQR